MCNLVEKEQGNNKVTEVVNCEKNEEEDWLPPPPKVCADVEKQIGEDSTIKQLRYLQTGPYQEYCIEYTKLLAIMQICVLLCR